MKIRNVTAAVIHEAAECARVDLAQMDPLNKKGTGFNVRLRPTHPWDRVRRGQYNGRRLSHIPCWHAWRDFLLALYARAPEATCRSSVAVYSGREDFQEAFSGTGYRNIGSQMQPVRLEVACTCTDEIGDDGRRRPGFDTMGEPTGQRGALVAVPEPPNPEWLAIPPTVPLPYPTGRPLLMDGPTIYAPEPEPEPGPALVGWRAVYPGGELCIAGVFAMDEDAAWAEMRKEYSIEPETPADAGLRVERLEPCKDGPCWVYSETGACIFCGVLMAE